MSSDHYQYVVRIFVNGKQEGSGFLATPNHVLTCAHVISNDPGTDITKLKISVAIPGILNEEPIPICYDDNFNAGDIDIVCLLLSHPVQITRFPPLVTYASTEVIDQSCTVYVNHAKLLYGYTEAIIRRPVNSSLFQANKTDNGLEIDDGHSGTPVWLGDSVIGLVRRADGSGIFNFVPSNLIIDHWPLYDAQPLNAQNLFELPSGYVRRKQDYQRILDTLMKPQAERYRMLLVTGPSGVGKSKLIIDIYQQLPDILQKEVRIISGLALRSFQNLANTIFGLSKGDFLVIDDVKEGDQVIESNWLKRDLLQSLNIILVSAAKDYLINRIKLKLECEQRKIYSIAIAAMRDEDAMSMLNDIPMQQLNIEQKNNIIKEIGGYPILLTILREAFEQEQDSQIDLYESIFTPENTVNETKLNSDDLSKKIVETWLNQASIKTLNRKVVTLLSSLSITGLTPKVLVSVFGCSAVDITMSLQLLRRKGLIYLIVSPDGHDKLVIIHDLLKKIIARLKPAESENIEKQYLEYIKFNACRQSPTDCELVMQIDVLVHQMRTLWEMTRNDAIEINHFYQQMIVYSRELDRFLPVYTNTNEKAQWIAELFGSYISTHCTMLVPLARAIKNLQPNTILAQMMWQGTENIFDLLHEDALARSCCITAAFRHWLKLNYPKDLTISLANKHLDDVFNSYRSKRDYSDHEIAALVGGICIMGGYSEALAIIETNRYKYYFPQSPVAIAVYLLALWALWEKNAKDKHIEATLRRVMAEKSALIREGQAKQTVYSFLKSHGFPSDNLPAFCRGEEFGFSNETAGTVGQMAHNDVYLKFLEPLGLGNSWV